MTVAANAPRRARDVARAQLTREITATARAQLAVQGPAGLSLRAVARELGMASSAVYRYFPSRDDLLTALITEAYDDLGASVEAAEGRVRRRDLLDRWRAVCREVRTWALAHRHEYALLYGSPVPGYAAPSTTIGPAGRVTRLMVALLRDAGAAGRDPGLGPDAMPVPHAVHAALASARADIGGGLSDDAVVRGLMAWTAVFGAISFELFGHLVGSVDDPDVFFAHEVDRLAAQIGLA